MTDAFAGLCYLGRRDGIVVPVQRETDAVPLDAGRSVAIHVFPTAPQASAFASGIRLAGGNRWAAGTGIGTLARLVALECLDGSPQDPPVVDHGGAAMLQQANAWTWLAQRVRVYNRKGPRHPVLMFVPRDVPELRIDHHTFRLDQDEHTLSLRMVASLDGDALLTALADARPTGLTPHPEGDTVRMTVAKASLRTGDLTAVVAILKDLTAIGDAVRRAEFHAQRSAKYEKLRRHRRYCLVVEKMQRGWTLTNDQGRGDLRPPAGVNAKGQMLGYAMLDDLLAADLIRLPEGAERHAHNWYVVYRIGDLTGSAVRPPTPGKDRR